MTTANTFHTADTRVAVERTIAEGPLDPDELNRRAVVTVHNALATEFGSLLDTVVGFPVLHPETRQVAARSVQILDDLGREFRP